MKLLPKSAIDRAKATEQRVAVEEGLKLARRVDNLREVAAETEAAWEKFRSETIAKIHEEIKNEVERRDRVKKEADEAEERRDIALKPLDEEWAKVKKAESAVELRKSSVEEQERLVSEKGSRVVELKKEAKSALLRAQAKDAVSEALLADATRDSEAAQIALKNALKVEANAKKMRDTLGEEITHREKVVAGQEKSATLREIDLSAREKALTDGWRLLKDREAQLERNIKRTK